KAVADAETACREAGSERLVLDDQLPIDIFDCSVLAGLKTLDVLPELLVAPRTPYVLALVLLEAAEREMEDVGRMKPRQRREPLADDPMRAEPDDDVGVSLVGDLGVRPVGARGIVERRLGGEARSHALCERSAVVRPRHEVAGKRPEDPDSLGDCSEHFLQGAGAGHPELVRIGI